MFFFFFFFFGFLVNIFKSFDQKAKKITCLVKIFKNKKYVSKKWENIP